MMTMMNGQRGSKRVVVTRSKIQLIIPYLREVGGGDMMYTRDEARYQEGLIAISSMNFNCRF